MPQLYLLIHDPESQQHIRRCRIEHCHERSRDIDALITVEWSDLPRSAPLTQRLFGLEELKDSAQIAAHRLLSVLHREGLWQESLRVAFSVDVLEGEVHRQVRGRSADLAFALGIAAQLRGLNLPALAATGVLDEEGWVGAVDKVPQKLDSAIATLPPGALVFYPHDNRADLTAEIEAQATARGIGLVAVERLEEALGELGVDIHSFKTPYLGLASFGFADAGIFFGRDQVGEALKERLLACRQADTPALLVIGASGSGKSSIVQAGLLPLLVRAPDAHWCIARVEPRNLDPDRLPQALWDAWRSDHAIGERLPLPEQIPPALALGPWLQAEHPEVQWLLVLDQLEEVFHASSWDVSARTGLSRVLSALLDNGVTVVATLRSDFVSAYIGSPLKACFEDRLFTLAAPEPQELRQIIEQPARQAGLRFEERDHKSLAAQIEEDAAGQGDVLPLLEFALTRLHAQRDSQQHQLLWRVYEQTGGLHGSIGSEAEAKFQSLSSAARAALPELLWSLAAIRHDSPDQDERIVARPAPAADPQTQLGLFELEQTFVDARLLVRDGLDDAGDVRIRVAHEALLTHWPRASDWIEQFRDMLKRRGTLEQQAAEWQRATETDKARLLMGAGKPLEDAKDLLDQWTDKLPVLVVRYIEHWIQAAQQRDEATGRRRRLVRNAFAIGALTAAVLAIVATWNAQEARRNADQARQAQQLAEANELRAVDQEREANRRLIDAKHNLALMFRERAQNAARERRFSTAYLYDLHALINGRADWVDRSRVVGDLLTTSLIPARFVSPSASCECGTIYSLAYSPDRKTLATGSDDHRIRLWDLATGKLNATLNGHTAAVSEVAFSGDGKTLASSSWDATVRLWEVPTGYPIATLKGHMDSVTSVAVSSGATVVASGSRDKTVRLWNASTGNPIATFRGHTAAVTSVALSSNGRVLASGAEDKTVRVWDTQTGASLALSTGYTGEPSSVAISPDSRLLASSSLSHSKIQLWSPETGEPLAILRGHRDGVVRIAFSPDGETLASASVDLTIRLWNLAAAEPMQTLSGYEDLVSDIGFSSDGKTLASSSRDVIRFWDIASGQQARAWETAPGRVNQLAFSPDGKTLATSNSYDNTVRLWDVVTGKMAATLIEHPGFGVVNGVAFSPDGNTLAVASGDLVRLWDVMNRKPIRTLTGHTNDVHDVAFSPDGRTLASCSNDSTVRLWDTTTGELKTVLKGHSNYQVLAMAFSPNSTQIASSDVYGHIRLWDIQTESQTTIKNTPILRVESLAFSPDGRALAAGSMDGEIRIWDLATQALLATLKGNASDVTSVVFSPNGKTLASGSNDGTVRIWDMQTGMTLTTLEGHTGTVESVAFSPDGKTVASGGSDAMRLWDLTPLRQEVTENMYRPLAETITFSPDRNTLAEIESREIHLFDVWTGKPTARLEGHTDDVETVAFSPDGRILASGARDNTIRLWDPERAATTAILENHSAPVTSVAFSPKGAMLASGSLGEVFLWDLKTSALRATLTGHGRYVKSITFSANGDILASAGYDDPIHLWDTGTGTLIATLQSDEYDVQSIAFSPDGKTLASCTTSTVQLWDVATGALEKKLSVDGVYRVAFSGDGTLLALSTSNATALVDVATELPVAAFPGHGLDVYTELLHAADRRDPSTWNNKPVERIAVVERSLVTQLMTGRLSPRSDGDEATDRQDIHLPSQHGQATPDVQRDHQDTCPQGALSSYDYLRPITEDQLREVESRLGLTLDGFDVQASRQPNILGSPYCPPYWEPSHPNYWLSKAEDGDTNAMVELGIIYERAAYGAEDAFQGYVDRMNREAIHWYRRSAQAGNARGKMYLSRSRQWLKDHPSESGSSIEDEPGRAELPPGR